MPRPPSWSLVHSSHWQQKYLHKAQLCLVLYFLKYCGLRLPDSVSGNVVGVDVGEIYKQINFIRIVTYLFSGISYI